MTHFMNLQPEPFELISNGTKTIELRLLDEKRKNIAVSDILIFKKKNDESNTISCTVKKLHVFNTFEELYRSLPLEKCGYLPHQVKNASAKDMEIYYSKETQKRYGVVGIEIELIK
ncbi:MAG: ASCH domain-containing protein [Ruminococcaceae bacterium]|nr:ASCH domain-containing protein [Oscillospiraceae bacterium]